MNKFKELGLSPAILEVLEQMGFDTPTPVQEKSIPILLGKDSVDFIGLAQTGTGKTAAFGLPLVELIDQENRNTQALIMAPTRELVQQTALQLVAFSRNHKKVNVEVVYGGAAIVNQIKALRKPVHIVVATPGRLLDLINRKAIHLENVRYVVLDEADEMLNMGFKDDIDDILSHTREERVTWLFSATMPGEIRSIVRKYMDNPVEVSVNVDERINKDISHKYVQIKTSNKIPALRRFLDKQPDMRGVMFCRTKIETQQIADDLGGMGYAVEALHGDLSQAQRDAVMKRFKKRSMQLLIATDVAARGIDVNDLTHVIHHTLPDQLEGYTHRSGRTARAGKKGISLAFINPRETGRIRELERKIKVKFEKIEVPSLEELKSSRINNWANLIINTKVDEQSDQILNQLHGQFAHLTKEDILKRLITTQLDHLMVDGNGARVNEAENLNEDFESPGSSRKVRSGKGNGNFNRYFVNIGVIDGVTKADLVHFLSDVSGIKRSAFGDMTMQKNCTFIDVDSSMDKGLSKSFKGIEIDGRRVRVNRDEEQEGRGKPAFSDAKRNYKDRKTEKGRSRGKKRNF